MGLNIKNSDAEAAIRELAAATGEGLTEAVEKAVKERLARLKRQAQPETPEDLLLRLQPLQRAVATGRRKRNEVQTSRQLLDALYDRHGLPK
ncbi:MAG TPA: type II toxin-antitoxin system VapB family antitoxin [Rhizomicrobium sp.]